jgi:RNA polymerase sigma factor (sigma-70 family)
MAAMGVPTNDDEFAELFTHQEWVRRLALRLCGDAAAADDVVQATWIEALQGRGEARSPRAWLGGIVRHLSRRVRRDERARADREARAARAEAMPSPESLLASAELQRRVLAAVASLDEAYRVVVLMHYYEDLGGEEIAARLGVPSSTVRNRLSRAHERLRAKLDREYGGDHAAWSALLAPSLTLSAAQKIAVGAGITMKIKLIAAAVLVAFGAVVLWRRSEGEMKLAQGLSAPVAATLAMQPVAESPPASASASSGNERTPVAATTDAAVEHVLLWGAIRGAEAADLESSTFRFVDEDGAEHPANVSKSSTYSVFGVKPGRCRIQATGRGFVPFEEDLVLAPDREKVRHDVTLERALVLPVKFVTKGDGTPFETPMSWQCSLGVVATRDRPARLAGLLARVPSAFGVGVYHGQERFRPDKSIPAGYGGVLEIREKPPVWVSCILHELVVESRTLQGGEKEIVFEIDPAQLESQLATVVVRCADVRDGKPIAAATVDVGFQDSMGGGRSCDAAGTVRIEKLVPGMRSVTARAPQFAGWERWVRVPPGGSLDLGTIELAPAATVRGRIVDPDGRGIGARVNVFSQRAFASSCAPVIRRNDSSAADGAFSLASVESGSLRIVAQHDDFALTALDVDATNGALDGIELRLEKGTPIELHVARGAWTGVECVIHDASGRPLAMASAYPMFIRRLRLKPGHYELGVIDGDSIVRREPLEVGTEGIVREVRAP